MYRRGGAGRRRRPPPPPPPRPPEPDCRDVWNHPSSRLGVVDRAGIPAVFSLATDAWRAEERQPRRLLEISDVRCGAAVLVVIGSSFPLAAGQAACTCEQFVLERTGWSRTANARWLRPFWYLSLESKPGMQRWYLHLQ